MARRIGQKRPKLLKSNSKVTHEFIEHYRDSTGEFITDIWYSPEQKRYTSILTDILGIPQGFSTSAELRQVLKKEEEEYDVTYHHNGKL